MIRYFIVSLFILSCKSYTTSNECSANKTIATVSNNNPKPQINIENSKDQAIKNRVQLQIDSIKSIATEGDIIFRGGTDIESNTIRDFSSTDKLFSHCGIVLKYGNALAVTHILGGTTNPDGSILSQTVEDFLSYPDNESAGIYATKLSKKQLDKLYHFIDSIQKSGVTFDLHFNLFTKQQLYCTELLIDALSFAKGNKKLYHSTSFNLKNTKYFFLSNEGDFFSFYPLDKFQHHKSLNIKAVFLFPNYQSKIKIIAR